MTATEGSPDHFGVNEVVAGLRVQIYADGADVARMLELARDPLIRGFTTNPTLMRQAGVTHYGAFVKELAGQVTSHPICFEVISDDFDDMERQAFALADLGPNVVVKIPITNTAGDSSAPLMATLAGSGIPVNATAITTLDQVRAARDALADGPPAIISVFAGRIADSGVNPVPVMREAKGLLADTPDLDLLWASPREILNVLHADEAGCDIITLTPELLRKMELLGGDLDAVSLATVRMFHGDALASGFEF